MKRKPFIYCSFILSFWVILSGIALAQEGFEKIIPPYNSGRRYSEYTEFPNGNFMWAGNKQDCKRLEGGHLYNREVGSVTKISGLGDSLWSKRYFCCDTCGAFTFFGSSLYSVAPTMDGGFIVGGNEVKADEQSIMAKIDGYGNVEWKKTHFYGGWSNIQFIKQLKDGGYIAAGATRDTSLSPNQWSVEMALVMRTDSAGNLLWKHFFMGYRDCYNVILQADGGFVFGVNPINFIDNPYRVYKINSAGEIVWKWEQPLRSDTTSYNEVVEFGANTAQTSDGGIAFSSTNFIHKIKEDGQGRIGSDWRIRLFGADTVFNVYKIGATLDGGLVVLGEVRYLEEVGVFGSYYSVLIKLDKYGKTECRRYFRGNWHVAKENNDLLFCYGFSDLKVLADGSYLLFGSKGRPSFQNPIEYHNILIKLYSCDEEIITSEETKLTNENRLIIHPNPSGGKVWVELGDEIASQARNDVKVRVLDLVGRVVLTSPNPSLKGGALLEVDLGKLGKGAYFIEVETGEGIKRGKVMLE